jgi:NHLM bacteriocin system ABC transporter ATP-binding protein
MTDGLFGSFARSGLVLQSGPLVHKRQRIPLDGRHPRLLDEPHGALELIRGHVDLFAVPIVAGAPAGARRHLCRIEASSLVLGLPVIADPAEAQSIGILAVGGQGAEAIVLHRTLIHDWRTIEPWIAALATAVVDTEAGWNVRTIECEGTIELQAGQQLRAPAHGVAWIAVESGEFALMGTDAVSRPSEPPMPLASRMWGTARGDTTVRILDGNAALAADPWPTVDRFHALAIRCIAARCANSQHAEVDQLRERIQRGASHDGQLLGELATVLVPQPNARFQAEGINPLLDACRVVAKVIDAPVIAPSSRELSLQGLTGAADIARVSQLRSRRVLLRGEWWHRNVGPLVAWRGDTREPVALIPVSQRHYVMVEPGRNASRQVDSKAAGEFAPEAVMLYRPLPALTGSAAGLIGFSLSHGSTDVVRILLAALTLGLIGLAPPLITQLLVDSVIPRSEWNQLAYCAAALVMVAIGVAGFRTLQSIAILRLQGALDRILQAGIIDRLLRLPVPFFRRYAAADLADRVLGIEAIRRIAVGHTIQGLLSGMSALFSFALMFYLDGRLALIAAALTLVRAAAIALASVSRLRRERKHFELAGNAQGLVLQLLTGVGKLRVACATQRALGVWARKFAEQKHQFVASQRTANLLTVFESVFPTLAMLLIFARVGGRLNDRVLDSGQFLAFFVAFGQSLEAVGQMANAIGAMLIGIPRIDRLRPLITESPEIAQPRNAPGTLTGAIELERVTFRYMPAGPTVLDEVTMQVNRGEYVAIVGPSGSGKSTLFRLLLGFEKPESGTILFDGKAIDALDIVAVRRQLGVILQNGKLTTGSLYENICGGAQLPLDRAWEAARLAGLERDIEAMPMGMHTLIAEGTSTLSGGQSQRLMIARALVHRPRILLFDEATSALDNRTQAIVSASLAELNVTRIVIAQRLSTVKFADRIIVFTGGKIVQSGTFAELAAAPGMFAEFAKRQLL